MDPTGPSNILPISPPEDTGFAAFFECFEALKEEEKKLNTLSSLFKNMPLAAFKGAGGLKFQAELLTILQKAKSEIEHLLQKMDKNDDAPVSPPIDPKKTSDLKELAKTFSAEKAKKFETLAETSGKKALQILSKKEAVESPKNSPTTAAESKKELNTANASAGAALPEPARTLAKQTLLHLALQQLAGALEMKILERAPPSTILQKIKPLIDHLIVVVETQENMARPSPKLVQLVRFLSQTFADMRQLSWLAFFKGSPESSPKPLQKSSSPAQKEHVLEKEGRRFEESSLEEQRPLAETSKRAPSQIFPPEKRETLSPLPDPKAIASLFTDKGAPETKREQLREIAPWAAPYTAPKSELSPRSKMKKKPKSPWRRLDKEDKEDDLP